MHVGIIGYLVATVGSQGTWELFHYVEFIVVVLMTAYDPWALVAMHIECSTT
jgi:hypothetical protein